MKVLDIKPISEVVELTRKFIKNRRIGKEKSLKVNSKKINDVLMDGFDWGRIITLAGSSGAGKSTLMRQWLKEFIVNNPEEKFEILTFQFEMLGQDEVARDLSAKLKLSVKEIYSAGQILTDSKMNKVEETLDEIKNYPISVVDNIGTVVEVKDTILNFVASKDLIKKETGLIVVLDHSLLVKASEKEGEKETLDSLMHTFVLIKKYLASLNCKAMFFILSQLNRNIESNERITNPNLHYPNKNDLFGSSSVYYSSDYVLILHRPSLIEGLGNWYGPSRTNWPSGLPVFAPEDSSRSLIYLHVIKERFGSNKIIPMLDDLEHSSILEYELK